MDFYNTTIHTLMAGLNRCHLLKRKIRVGEDMFDKNDILALCRHIEQHLAANAVELMKNDHAATVALIRFKNTPIVVKTYNPNKWRKYLSRGIRKSKALKSWEASKILSHKNIPTLTSIATIEDKLLFFKIRSYFISTYVDGVSADEFFISSDIDKEEKFATALRIIKSIQQLHDRRIFHGDPKNKNIIIRPDNIYIVDLDAMTYKRLVFNKKRKAIKDWRALHYSWHHSKENREIFLRAYQESFSSEFYEKLLIALKKHRKKKEKKTRKKERGFLPSHQPSR